MSLFLYANTANWVLSRRPSFDKIVLILFLIVPSEWNSILAISLLERPSATSFIISYSLLVKLYLLNILSRSVLVFSWSKISKAISGCITIFPITAAFMPS